MTTDTSTATMIMTDTTMIIAGTITSAAQKNSESNFTINSEWSCDKRLAATDGQSAYIDATGQRTMNIVKRLGITAAILLAAPIFIYAQPPAASQMENNLLQRHIDGSGCDFYRNGSWHDAKSALTLLHYKHRALAADNKINSAEEFIEKAPTPSSLSGHPYQARCNHAAVQPSDQWLQVTLVQFRAN